MANKLGPITAGLRGFGSTRSIISAEERDEIVAALKASSPHAIVQRSFRRGSEAIRKVALEAGLPVKELPRREKAHEDITVRLFDPVCSMLEAAARRRNLSASELATTILTAVVFKSSIDRPPDVDRAWELGKAREAEAGATLRV